MSVSGEILRSWRAPRQGLRRQLSAPASEGRALVYLMLACLLVFVAQAPRLARAAAFSPEVPLEARLGGALMGWLFIAPLAFYALAAISHLAARALGGEGSQYGARLALFWSLLVAAPFWLLHGLLAGIAGPGRATALLGLVVLAGTGALWLSALAEAERPEALEGRDGLA